MEASQKAAKLAKPMNNLQIEKPETSVALLQVNKGIFTFEKKMDGFGAESLASQASWSWRLGGAVRFSRD